MSFLTISNSRMSVKALHFVGIFRIHRRMSEHTGIFAQFCRNANLCDYSRRLKAMRHDQTDRFNPPSGVSHSITSRELVWHKLRSEPLRCGSVLWGGPQSPGIALDILQAYRYSIHHRKQVRDHDNSGCIDGGASKL